MGAGYVHKCNECGYSVSTSGPWEFYRDSKGKRKPYGHPVPMSEEARQRGIYGLSGALYCPNCDEVFDLILVEFKKPSQDSLSVWGGMCEPKDEFKDEGAVKCPKCDNRNLILGPMEDREVTCPRCKEGKMVGEMEWIS
jgi:DNA-directed RNA polymerase subunit M/transcription elongation factor TFIIS